MRRNTVQIRPGVKGILNLEEVQKRLQKSVNVKRKNTVFTIVFS